MQSGDTPLAQERRVTYPVCVEISTFRCHGASAKAPVWRQPRGAAINLLTKDNRSGWSNLPERGSSSLSFRGGFMTTQRHIDALRTVLQQIRVRLAMLELVAPLN